MSQPPGPWPGIVTALSGKQIPGGCEQCDAYQTAACDEPEVYRITVHHDDWCPWWTSARCRVLRRC